MVDKIILLKNIFTEDGFISKRDLNEIAHNKDKRLLGYFIKYKVAINNLNCDKLCEKLLMSLSSYSDESNDSITYLVRNVTLRYRRIISSLIYAMNIDKNSRIGDYIGVINSTIIDYRLVSKTDLVISKTDTLKPTLECIENKYNFYDGINLISYYLNDTNLTYFYYLLLVVMKSNKKRVDNFNNVDILTLIEWIKQVM